MFLYVLVLLIWGLSLAALNRLRKRLGLGGVWWVIICLPVVVPVTLTSIVAPITITQTSPILQWTFVLSFLVSYCVAVASIAFGDWPARNTFDVFE